MDQLYIAKLQLAEIQSLPANRSGAFVFMFCMISDKIVAVLSHVDTFANCCHLNLTILTVFMMSGTVLFPVQDVKELVTELKQQILEIETPLNANS